MLQTVANAVRRTIAPNRRAAINSLHARCARAATVDALHVIERRTAKVYGDDSAHAAIVRSHIATRRANGRRLYGVSW